MKILSQPAKLILICALVLACAGSQAFAQRGQAPVMENVFFNVVWGSAFGAILGVAVAVIGAEDKSAPEDARNAAFSGATAGGLIGLGLGLWVVYQGTTFEGADQPLVHNDPGPKIPRARAQALAMAEPPLVLLSSPERPHRITGFRATVFRMRF